ncbi:MAG: NAD(P)-dependent glycerol-3-phosphate dehydrogenase [Thermodesulfobacteriaceae bacterium]|nr:NAD(P)-dependent glycerol-3-phosphate dehydrogenase [Thermodesulfobacteriaceae bacterium]MCX8041967.1 NAD(P)-dependent glycerol-3-phosphate dehydrogenase [Thermodesulfobacteriaceae bacterium]MDW8136161.1 NAD(P)H-dependent glycerol-3-phosphate dehydrogenase [Thermodesulfobacterium sp.]
MKVTIIGGGSWGTALGKILAEKGVKTYLLVRRETIYFAINKEKENPFYLPGIKLPKDLRATLNPEEAFKDSKVVIWAIPSFALIEIFSQFKKYLLKIEYHISGIKGMDLEEKKAPFFLLKERLPKGGKIFVLGGPSFAKEVAEGLPTAVVLAGEKEEETQKLQELLANSYFRVYRSDDPIGVELAGALKNVIAIASGISDGLELGLNARAALITRGLVEIIRLGTKMGGNIQTFYGLAGLGDLVLTCTGNLSRNYQVGLRLGKGEKLEDILTDLRQVAEGVKTSKVVKNLAKIFNLEMPICEEVYRVLYEKEEPKVSLKRLLSRSLKKEFEI